MYSNHLWKDYNEIKRGRKNLYKVLQQVFENSVYFEASTVFTSLLYTLSCISIRVNSNPVRIWLWVHGIAYLSTDQIFAGHTR